MLAPLALSLLARSAHAESDPFERQELEKIAGQRQQVEMRYTQRERECTERFAVTSCLNTARAQRRDALAILREQELVLDEARRKRRAAKRIQTVRPAAGSSVELRRELARTPVDAGSMAPAASAVMSRPRLANNRADRSAQDAVNRRIFESKQFGAQAHRAAQAQRVERANKAKASMPLPLPAASDIRDVKGP